MVRRILAVLATAVAFTAGCFGQTQPSVAQPAVSSAAASGPDVYRLNYFRNLNQGGTFAADGSITGVTSPDDPIRIINPGTSWTPSNNGDLCAMIYVFDPEEELSECCGCVITPDQMIELGVQSDLIANPVTSSILHNGVIKIVSATPTGSVVSGEPVTPGDESGPCDPAQINAGTGTGAPTPTLRAWITHQSTLAGVPGITESEFQFAPLSATEQASLANLCSGIRSYASGHGVCSCPGSVPPPPPAVFTATGTPQTFTVPVTGTYHLVAAGAQGGSPTVGKNVGGLGAQIAGDFSLTAGQVLTVDVGNQGAATDTGGGGGGGTFVILNGATPAPLATAGGGGGAVINLTGGGAGNGGNGNADTNGSPGSGLHAGAGGSGGNGGNGGTATFTETGGGGGGFLTSGTAGSGPNSGGGGKGFPAGLAGGSAGVGGGAGGYGGGGGGTDNGGGGGGGYSGGGGGGEGSLGGGGGGSFNSGANQTNTAGANSGNGSVTITFLHT